METLQDKAAGKALTFAVIDGNSLMHRAFHAVQTPMNAPDGRPTNAIFGFMGMFLKLVEDFRPDGVMVAFDKGRPAVRMEMLPQYKAQRPPRDPNLSAQFPMMRELLGALRVPVYAVEGWEGDDLLGTLARQGSELGHRMLLVTGDRDAYQLATGSVSILANKKGMTDVAVLGPDQICELYEGVRPELIPDFYGLKGDTSDNIPGVPGIGPKKAAALIVQYGSLDAVLDDADNIKGKMGENIREHRADALVSREVARIRTDAPVEFDGQAALWPSFDIAEAERALDALSLRSIKSRVLRCAQACASWEVPGCGAAGLGSAAANLPAEPVCGQRAWELLRSATSGNAWVGAFFDAGMDEGSLFGDSQQLWLACDSGWGWADGCEQGEPARQAATVLRFDGDEALEALLLAYEGCQVVSFDTKSDLRELYPLDSKEPFELDAAVFAEQRSSDIFDVSVAAYLLDSDRSDFEPSTLVEAFLPWALPELVLPEAPKKGKAAPAVAPTPESRQARGICAAASLLALREVLAAKLEADGTLACMNDIEMPLVAVLSVLERNGMAVDPAVLAQQSELLAGQVAQIRERIFEAAGAEFNIDSPAQLSGVLFDTLGLPTRDPDSGRPLKKTKTGFYSTNAKLLEGFARDYPVVADVLDYRERVKIKSTYLDALPRQVLGDGRVHTTYNQTVTATGRLSSSDPNLQNIPVRSELGRMVRTAFVPGREGNVILSCDYSQIELRLLAHLSGDAGLVEAFLSGEDFHRQTAARVFGIDPAQVTPAQRSKAKAVNFGIVYGQTSWGLSQSLKIGKAEAQEMIDRYYATYPGVRTYLDEQVAQARAKGYVETMFGRKRHVPAINASVPTVRQFAERTAMNHPMQGSAADIIKLAMVRVQRKLSEQGFSAKMIVQVHDELDFDCPADEVEELSAMVVEQMQGVAQLKVPLLVSCARGLTWAEAK
jgi:DNA polymerase I